MPNDDAPARPTSVVKVSGRRRDEFLADPDFAYVGREFAGFAGSIFGNPFRLPAQRSPVLSFARLLLWAHDTGPPPPPEETVFNRMVSALPSLRGKRLGCWCLCWGGEGEPPMGCHAVVLALAADGRWDEVREFVEGEASRA